VLVRYTATESLVDGFVHVLGATMSLVAIAILIAATPSTSDPVTSIATAVYGFGLVSMFWISAAYHLITTPGWKERMRRFDHAAIFVMIAGTYTPFTLIALRGPGGELLFCVVWLVAIGGVTVKLMKPRRYDRSAIIAYLAHGWVGFLAFGRLISALPPSTLALLVVGGLLYTAGVAFHLCSWLRFQNAIWHVFVLAGASCHFAAVLKVVVR
jgi:hemolysin III